MSLLARQLLRIRDDYRASGAEWPATARMIAEWAVAQKRYDIHRFAAVGQCARAITRAFNQDYKTDNKGRRVRVMHARRSPQGTLWDHFDTIPRDNMHLSLMQRRNGIVGVAKQIKIDVDGYNDAHPDVEPIQMTFDLRNDLADAGLLSASSTAPERQVVRPAPVPADSRPPLALVRPSSRPSGRA